MTFPRSTLGRLLLVLLAVWIVVSILFLIAYNSGSKVPGDGLGERIEMAR